MTNYQKELDNIINDIVARNVTPKLLIHSCCGPCSSYVLEYLSEYFAITVYYYNSNIYPPEEYVRRAKEQQELIQSMPLKNPVEFRQGPYQPEEFYQYVKGHEKDPEGGERCFLCYRQRLEETAKMAHKEGFDYYTTTLSISPHKNAAKLNEIGNELAQIYGTTYLSSDFKKKNGYKRSIELSNEYNLYRQEYCGCVFSIRKEF